MWRLSAFADEISPDLDRQIETLTAERIRWLDLRGVWNKNVLDLSDDELDRTKAALDQHGIGVAAIGSPIGKIPITDPFASHLDAFHRTLAIARHLESPYVRVFSFFMPPGEEPARHRDAVLRRLTALVRAAEAADITLLHENERHIYGDTPDRCHDLLTAIGSSRLGAVWDPANFVNRGVRPFAEGYELLRPFIAYVHVKDAVLGEAGAVPAGKGDGDWPATITALRDSGFDGFFALEPHLARGGRFGGFSGTDDFRTAVKAFKHLLQQQNVAWS